MDQLRDILKGEEVRPDVVYHVASYGMSGHQMVRVGVATC